MASKTATPKQRTGVGISNANRRTLSREQSPHSCSIEVFKKHRQEARQRYHKPLTEHIEALGRIVFGPTFAVDLDDDLAVARRTLCGVTLDVDHLSTGAFEQLGLLSRLACALIVSPGGGAPVVIDDALGWSDPPHLERMGPPTPPVSDSSPTPSDTSLIRWA